MTRINIVPPTELTDQHLMAEYIVDKAPSINKTRNTRTAK